jgi:hypothetical protein
VVAAFGTGVGTCGTAASAANATNGNPTSTQATGPAGPTGPTGATGTTGAIGSQGAAGKIELVTCKTVTVIVKKKVKGKTKKVKKTEQKCTGKLVSGTVKFTATGSIVKARLSRGGEVYATGTVRMGGAQIEGALTIHHQMTRGRDTLTLFKQNRVLARQTVTAG